MSIESLNLEIDLVNYPNITISQTPGFLNPSYRLHLPLRDVSKLFQNVFASIPNYEKANISIKDKLLAAKLLGLNYIYRMPDLYRTSLYSAGAVLIALGLSENKFIQLAANTAAETALKTLPKLANSSFISNTSKMGRAILANKAITGAALITTGLASNAISDAASESLIQISRSLKDLTTGVLGIVPGLYRGTKKAFTVSAAALDSYKNAWTNNKKTMIHTHALVGIAAVALSAHKIA